MQIEKIYHIISLFVSFFMLGLARRSVKFTQNNHLIARTFRKPFSHLLTAFASNTGIGNQAATQHRLLHSTQLYCNKQSKYSITSPPIVISTDLKLTLEEKELFSTLLKVVKDRKLNTTVRVAGGWVRDRILGGPRKNDVDIALEGMTGVEFTKHWNKWLIADKKQKLCFAVIQQNPDRSKHLETVTIKFGELQIDLVNLRTEEYTTSSRIPVIETGTPYQDAHRRDLTINSLFYNIHTKNIEDYTQKGLYDIKHGIVRTPLPALITLTDDPLRAYRIIRFACRFSYNLLTEVIAACQNTQVHENISSKVSRERIKDELLLMFTAPSAVRAVYLLYSYNLLATLIKFPNNIIKRKNSQTIMESNRHMNVPTHTIPIIEKEKELFIKNFFHIGVSTILVSQYMRQFVLRAECKERWNYTQRYMNQLATTGDLAKDFILTSLVSPTENMYTEEALMPTAGATYKSGRPERVKTLPLAEVLLQTQLKFPNRDGAVVKKHLIALAGLRECLEQAGIASTTNSTLDSSDSSSSSDQICTEFKGISRLKLGNVLRHAGEQYEYTLLLAAAQLAVQRLTAASLATTPSTGNNISFNPFSRIINDMSKCIDSINPTPISNSNSSDVLSKVTVGKVGIPKPTAHPITSTVDKIDTIWYDREISFILDSVELLLRAIEAMALKEVWKETAPMNGKILQKLFPNIHPPEIISEMKNNQIEWKLRNPSGSEEELLQYLTTKYHQFK